MTLKKLNNLIIPFISFYLIGGLIQSAGKIAGVTESWFDPLFVFRDFHFVNGPIWFLLCLFYCNIIFLLIKSVPGPEVKNLILIAICGIIGYHWQDNYSMFLGTAFTTMPYFYFGYILKQSGFLVNNIKSPFIIGALMLTATVLIIHFCGIGAILFCENIHNSNPVISFICSCSLVIGTLLVCKSIEWLPFVSYIGRYSIVLLCTHAIVMMVVSKFGAKIGFIKGTTVSLITYDIIMLAIVLLTCWLFIPILKKYLPFAVAQKDLIPTGKPQPQSQTSN